MMNQKGLFFQADFRGGSAHHVLILHILVLKGKLLGFIICIYEVFILVFFNGGTGESSENLLKVS